MGAFASDADLLDSSIGDVVEQVELCSSLLLTEPLVLLAQNPMQPQNGCIGDHHVSELVELIAHSVWNGDLVEREFDEVAEIRGEQRCQPLIETAGRERLVGSNVVGATKRGECSALACGEAEHERPDHRWYLELAVAFDHAEGLGVVFQRRRWKERSEPPFNSIRGGFWSHTELLLIPLRNRLRFQPPSCDLLLS